jgi:transposase-like protein
MYRKGRGYGSIARVFGCADSTIKKWVEQSGIEKHKRPNHTERTKKNVIQYYRKNDVSMAAVAKKYGVHPKTVSRWISEAGVPSRSVRKFSKSKILSDIRSGMPGAAVARKHGCSESYVSAIRNGRI